MSEKGMKSSHDGSMNEEFADSPRLRSRPDGDISISSSSSPSFLLTSCPSSVLSVEKRGLDRSLSTRPPRKSPSGETTRWLCPLLRASGPLEFFVGLSQETPGRRSAYLLLCHPEVIQRVSSISRRSREEKTRLTPSRRLSLVMAVRWLIRGWKRGFFFVWCFTNFSYYVFFSDNGISLSGFSIKKVLHSLSQ